MSDDIPPHAHSTRSWQAKLDNSRYETFRSLDEARACPDAVAFLEYSFYENLAVCPVRCVETDEATLQRLFRDLVDVVHGSPRLRGSGSSEGARIYYETPLPDFDYQTFGGVEVADDLRVHHDLQRLGLSESIEDVIRGRSSQLDPGALARVVGQRACFEAVERGDVEAVGRFLAEGFAVDTRHEFHGKTALGLAAYDGDAAMIRLLLEHGADPNAERFPGDSPTTAAAVRAGRPGRRDPGALELLKAAGGRIGLRELVMIGDVETARRLCDADPTIDVGDLARWTSDDTTFLMLAVKFGHIEMARFLLDRGADIEASDEEYGFNALTIAARSGRVDLVSLLLDRGADMDREFSGYTALAHAAEHDQAEAVRILLDRGARRVLIDAVILQDATMVSSMLSAPEPPGRYIMGEAREHAARRGDAEILRSLLEAAPLDRSDVSDAYDLRSLVAVAAESGHLEAVRLLISRGADPHGLRGGATPADRAERAGHADVAAYLRGLER